MCVYTSSYHPLNEWWVITSNITAKLHWKASSNSDCKESEDGEQGENQGIKCSIPHKGQMALFPSTYAPAVMIHISYTETVQFDDF